MKKAQASIVSSLAFAAIIGAAPSAGQDFYVVRLKQGEAALAAQRPVEAIDQLRIANFGLLERPALLTEGLVFLALSFAQAERPADVDATISRFVEMEARFGAYPKAAVEADVRARFEDLLRRRVRPDVLAQIPSLAPIGLADRARARLATGDPKGALADLRALPASRFASEPSLWADLFVALAGSGEMAEAKSAWRNVPEPLRSRSDVAAAKKKLPAK